MSLGESCCEYFAVFLLCFTSINVPAVFALITRLSTCFWKDRIITTWVRVKSNFFRLQAQTGAKFYWILNNDISESSNARRKSTFSDWSNCCFLWKIEWNVLQSPRNWAISLLQFSTISGDLQASRRLFPCNLYLRSNTFRCKSNL